MIQTKEIVQMNDTPEQTRYGTVLVIDGDTNSQREIYNYLRKSFSVLTAHDGHAGIETAVSSRPDAIMLDFKTPFLDGLSALMLLKDFPETKDIPVMMIGAGVKKTRIVAAIKSGAASIMLKPLKEDILNKKLVKLVKERES